MTKKKMTPEDVELWDARATEEAWRHALGVLNPMLEIAEVCGSDELVGLLKRAEEEGGRELDRALDRLQNLRGKPS